MKLTLFSTFIFCFFCSLTIYGQFVAPKPCFECSDNQALGNKSTAAGKGNVVLGDYSVAFGENNTVSGKHAYAFGYQNEANGLYSGAFGHSSRAEGDYSFVLGRNSISNHNFSTVIGSFSNSNNLHSFIFGSFSETAGDNSFVLGNSSKALAIFGFALGYYVETRASEAFTIGLGRVDAPIVNEIPRSLMIGINSDLPSFFIEDSGGEGKTGKIGIGNITAPTAKLHIKADDNENATLFLQASDWNNTYAELKMGTADNAIRAEKNVGLSFYTEKDFLFDNGNVGIGTIIPFHPLHVNGNIMIDGTAASLLFEGDSKLGWGEWGIEYESGGLNFWKPSGSNNFGNYYLFLADNGKVGIGTDEPSGLLSLYKNDPEENLGISFQNGSSTRYWIGHNASNNLFYIGGQGGTTPELGAINILNGNVGIGQNQPEKALDVNGDINFTGDLYKDSQLLKINLWEENDSGINYNDGKVGIGIADPQADLHIVNTDGNVDRTHIKIESPNGIGSGTTVIGRLSGSGPVIIQKAGNNDFTNGGPCLSFRQLSFNDETGLRLSTFTNTDGSVNKATVECVSSSLHAIAKDNLYLRSNEGGIEFQIGGYNTKMRLNEYGQLGIGTTSHDDQDTKLTVAGRIHAQEVKVTAGAGADFVFDDDYDLPDINELDSFIKTNKHLPDIPSAEEMKTEGLNLGEMQIKLLQKVEELTLYVIELKKENEEMKGEIETLKEK